MRAARHTATATEVQINCEIGDAVVCVAGAFYGSVAGVIVDIVTDRWGTHAKIALDDGTEDWTDHVSPLGTPGIGVVHAGWNVGSVSASPKTARVSA